MELDKVNGNTKWADAINLERTQLDDYETFETVGYNIPAGYETVVKTARRCCQPNNNQTDFGGKAGWGNVQKERPHQTPVSQ